MTLFLLPSRTLTQQIAIAKERRVAHTREVNAKLARKNGVNFILNREGKGNYLAFVIVCEECIKSVTYSFISFAT